MHNVPRVQRRQALGHITQILQTQATTGPHGVQDYGFQHVANCGLLEEPDQGLVHVGRGRALAPVAVQLDEVGVAPEANERVEFVNFSVVNPAVDTVYPLQD